MNKENTAVELEVVATALPELSETPIEMVVSAKAKRPELAKKEIFDKISKLLHSEGIVVQAGDKIADMTASTLIVSLADLDVQIKIITPSVKAIRENGGRYGNK